MERVQADQLASRVESYQSEPWGVLAAELDPTALDSGTVSILRFEGILPDGTPVSFDRNSAELPATRPVEGYFESHQAVLEVFLALPRTQETRSNVGTKGGPTRYFGRSEPLHDRHGQAEPVDVQMAVPNLQLLFGTEPRQDYAAIKLFELKRSGTGQLVLADDYIPPFLRISASANLRQMLERLLTSMNARRGALLQDVRHRDGTSAEFTTTDVTRFLLLSAINGNIPVLKHMCVAGDFSAKQTYLCLCQLAGELATFSAEFDPNDLPRFAYEDLRTTFGTIISVIDGLVKASMEARYVAVPLLSQGDGLYLGQIDDARFARCREFVLGVKSVGAPAEIASTLPRLTKLASATDIQALLSSATAGVALHATAKPPAKIPTRSGTAYFTVSPDSEYWRAILIEGRAAMFLPRTFPPEETELQLFGVLD